MGPGSEAADPTGDTRRVAPFGEWLSPFPIELLAKCGCLGPRTTVVHATHADERELDLIAEAGARVCLCLTTEANLGDGFAPVEQLCERGIGICIGSDSNVRIDPLEELRELEGIARRRTGPLTRVRCAGTAKAAAARFRSWHALTRKARQIALAAPNAHGLWRKMDTTSLLPKYYRA